MMIMVKMAKSKGKDWIKWLGLALFIDCTLVRKSYSRMAYYLIYSMEAILPLEIRYPTWRLIRWDFIEDAESLFEVRLRALCQLPYNIERAREYMAKY